MKNLDSILQTNHDFELGQVKEINTKRDDLAKIAKKLLDSNKITAFAYIKILDANDRKAF